MKVENQGDERPITNPRILARMDEIERARARRRKETRDIQRESSFPLHVPRRGEIYCVGWNGDD